ncbi:hypothetical protein [Streptomyces sp. EAG2]|uniref:hypothetical protein n=1 Tax=Streptomyces sp. EAG2 TaxID=2056495 RepID=UPI000C6E8A53|nr:hypothetical protein [Streptomyces sp. EAG2]PKR43414.1 hypothetical protein CWE27_20765 [Streptomyces sp. EAG2]
MTPDSGGTARGKRCCTQTATTTHSRIPPGVLSTSRGDHRPGGGALARQAVQVPLRNVRRMAEAMASAPRATTTAVTPSRSGYTARSSRNGATEPSATKARPAPVSPHPTPSQTQARRRYAYQLAAVSPWSKADL